MQWPVTGEYDWDDGVNQLSTHGILKQFKEHHHTIKREGSYLLFLL